MRVTPIDAHTACFYDWTVSQALSKRAQVCASPIRAEHAKRASTDLGEASTAQPCGWGHHQTPR